MRASAWSAVVAAALTIGAAPPPSADERVKALADREWRERSEADPARAAAAQFDYPDISEAAFQRGVAKARAMLRALDAIPVAQLGEDARLTYDVLREGARIEADRAPFYWIDFQIVPYRANGDFGYFRWLFSSRPVATDDDRRRYLHLIREYRDLFRQHLAKLQGQERRGIRLPKPGIANVLDLVKGIAAGLDSSVGIAPARAGAAADFPATVRREIDAELRPALTALIAYLEGSYRAAAPEAMTVSQYPGGRDYYRYLVRSSLTLDIAPAELHALGLKRMAELEARVHAAAARIGLKGTLPEIYAALRKDPRFIARTPDEVATYYMAQLKLIEPKLPAYFARLPKAPYGVQRLPPERERGSTFGYYAAAAPPAEPRGLYIYNGWEVEKRSLLNARALIYHELMPGHHLQVALQAENTALHPLRQEYWLNGYGEGWAEYASSLGYEMGLYDDPHAELGRLALEMFLTSRLVVDTGLGFYGWPLERARDYMRRRVFLSDVEIDSETVRYATVPGQALAYRVAFERMWELRRRAEAALGERFDVRAFHTAMLDGGHLPLASLEAKIDRWIARQRRG